MFSQIRETRRILREFRDEWKQAGYSMNDALDSISIALMKRPKLIVLGVFWVLFAMGTHSENAISIAVGATVALLVLVMAEAGSNFLLRIHYEARERAGRVVPEDDDDA